jgi:PKD repeat protein
VSDGINAPVVRTATLTVGNAVPVITTPATPSAPLVPDGSTVSVGLSFADPGTNDTHTASVNWGDASTSPGTVVETAGAGSVSRSHVYAAPGLYTVVVTVTDDNGGSATSTTQIRVNSSPTVSAGGPYSGVEGTGVPLNGTVTDPDGDTVTVSWTRTIVTAPAGTICTFTGTTTLTPALTCNDQATVNVTLNVTDGFNPAVSDTAQVTVANAAPVVAPPTATPNPVAVGTATALGAAFTDSGKHDSHTATIAWGDSSTSAGTVSETPGSGAGTVAASHTYTTPGTYTVTVTVHDGVVGGTNTTTIVVNGGPSASAGGPYSGYEGSYIVLNGTVGDPEDDPGGILWTFTKVADPGTTCTTKYTTTLHPKIKCTDDAVVTATMRVSDGINAPIYRTATITILNKPPTIGTVCLPTSPVSVGTTAKISASFADAGRNDTHTASIDWGDGTSSVGTIDEDDGSGTAYGSHVYTSPGAYKVTVTITDDDGGATTAVSTKSIVVYSTSTGFVTGGGYIDSPSGSYTPATTNDENGQGRANFGFVAKSTTGSPTPTGNTEFQLRLRKSGGNSWHDDDDDDEHESWRERDRRGHDDGWDDDRFSDNGLNFHSTSYVSLTVNSGLTKAIFKGFGRVNNVSGYEFLVSVIDGRRNGADKFRIKIWKTSNGEVIYDNQAGAVDDANAVTNVSCGSIVIHGS